MQLPKETSQGYWTLWFKKKYVTFNQWTFYEEVYLPKVIFQSLIRDI